jgi:formate hydrogenlyase transcriptional activator
LEQRVSERTEALSKANADLRAALAEIERLRDRLQAENVYLKEEIRDHYDHCEIVGHSKGLREVLGCAERVAPTDSTVLVSGETGTGKEMIARFIHQHSQRAGAPMVKLNCAAISAGLVESELFGHVKGAFTGATDKRVGRFELADKGTLFLDEVSELPLETQAKLLRVLQEREFEPVGSSSTRHVDVRVISATNRDLAEAVSSGRFRADLYYRLNVVPIEVPPLRKRREDIPELIEYFLSRNARKLGRTFKNIEPQTLTRLMEHDWPGNIRDLQNTIERFAIMCENGETFSIEQPLESLTLENREKSSEQPVSGANPVPSSSTLADMERAYIISVLRKTSGVIEGPKGAAALLDLKPSTARHRIKKLGITKHDYLY